MRLLGQASLPISKIDTTYQYSETNSVKFNDANVYNVRKVHFQANLCEAFADYKAALSWRLMVLGWAVLRQPAFNH